MNTPESYQGINDKCACRQFVEAARAAHSEMKITPCVLLILRTDWMPLLYSTLLLSEPYSRTQWRGDVWQLSWWTTCSLPLLALMSYANYFYICSCFLLFSFRVLYHYLPSLVLHAPPCIACSISPVQCYDIENITVLLLNFCMAYLIIQSSP